MEFCVPDLVPLFIFGAEGWKVLVADLGVAVTLEQKQYPDDIKAVYFMDH